MYWDVAEDFNAVVGPSKLVTEYWLGVSMLFLGILQDRDILVETTTTMKTSGSRYMNQYFGKNCLNFLKSTRIASAVKLTIVVR